MANEQIVCSHELRFSRYALSRDWFARVGIPSFADVLRQLADREQRSLIGRTLGVELAPWQSVLMRFGGHGVDHMW